MKDLDLLHNRDNQLISRAKKIIQSIVFILVVLIFAIGGEVLMTVAIWFALSKTLRKIFDGELKFIERWAHLSIMLIVNFLFIIISGFLAAEIFPQIGEILFFSIR